MGPSLQPLRLRQLFKQRLGFLQIRGIEPLDEPAVDGGEEIAGLGGLAQSAFKRIDKGPRLSWDNHGLNGMALWLRRVRGQNEPFVVLRAVVDDGNFTRAS